MRKTHATVQVAMALMNDAHARHWGYDLTKVSGVRSGVLYPILHRLLEEGLLEDGWEEANDRKRPARRYYVLTETGMAELGGLLAAASADRRFAGLKVGFAR
ncbi:MAG: PadR family transcriptional regulator [Actinomycetota bacterium]|nr:PadR family transcriptional regulator [Actinomycetota bacterium]